MPELPEVETIKRTLSPLLKGRLIKEIEVGLGKLLLPGEKEFIARVAGRRFLELKRKGKYLICLLSGGTAVIVHFRLTGQLIYVNGQKPLPPHTHLRFFLDRGELLYVDLRQFGRLEALAAKDLKDHPQLKELGPEPFALNERDFYGLLQKSSRPLKALLLDQKVISGLGNIYVDESLFRAGLHPKRPGKELTLPEASRLLAVIKEILAEAISDGGSSVRNYVDGQGQSGRFQEKHRVYGRRGKPCPRCGQTIAYTKIAQRGTHFCPACQK